MRRAAFGRCIVICLTGSVLAFLVGCVTRNAQTRPMEIRTLYSSAMGDTRLEQAGATWLDSPAALAAAFNRLTRSRLQAGKPPAVDFDDHGVLLIEMGRRNTGGYRVSLAAPRLQVVGDRALVHVAWIEPDARAMVTQVITSPCLLLEIPRAGFSSIQVVDQEGRVRATVDVGKR